MTHQHHPQQLPQENFSEQKEMFRVIFEHSPAAITVADANERIVTWNRMAEKMLGMSKKELFNRPVHEFFPVEEWERLRSLNIRKKGMQSDIMTKVICHDGTTLDVNASITVLKDSKGEIIGSICILNDLTQSKVVEKELVQAKLVAEEANHAKSVFLAKMSHEVRTPMNAIIGMIDLTLDTSLSEEQKDNLVVAKDSAQNLLSLINDILDLSRAEAGKVVIEEMEIQVADIVKNVCKGLAVLARSKQIDLVWTIDPKLPRVLIGDAVRLRQILMNLVNNAIKFTHQGKVEARVHVESLSEDDCVVKFEIVDQGIGIPKKNIETVFDVFTEAHNTTARRYGGTGLGLAICKKLVEMMRGQLWVDSVEGQGSTFCFTIIFGYKPHAISTVQDKTGQNVSVALPEEVKHLRILVAEDNLINQKITVKILEKFGWQSTAVINGQEVLDILLKQSFDVILMDDQMPVLDGVATTQVIRREEKQTGMHVPIIAMTANAMSGDRERYLTSGMDGYVSKPIERTVLYNEIVTLVSQRMKN
ncbi:MAG: PAS domain S-box protein [Candidatus Omnitrophica bacterium]|nr:PAS domain S-box protein [Candidatus Omnitrophota bacterium]